MTRQQYRRARHPRGVTLIELVLAVFLTGVVALSAGFIYLTNQRSFRQGREKLMMQQNVSWCVEEISRDLRRARRVNPVNASEIVLYDVQGAAFSTWRLGTEAGENRLQRNDQSMAPEECTFLQFTVLNADTSTIGVALELMDDAENRVRMETRTSLRNRDVP